jgi:cytochrome-b5 reductase
MATPHKHKPVSVMDPQFVHGVYIPSALLMVGTIIVKKEWWPFALLLVVGLGGWKLYSSRKIFRSSRTLYNKRPNGVHVEARKVLKPTEFQEFELKEKTVMSHNTAM